MFTPGWCATSKRTFSCAIENSKNLTHLNRLAEQWLREEADQRLHGTVKEVVAERFVDEWQHLQALPAMHFDTAYRKRRVVAWDGYIEVRGNRYSVPGELCGALVEVHIGLDAQWQFIMAQANWSRGIGSSPPPAGYCCPSMHHQYPV